MTAKLTPKIVLSHSDTKCFERSLETIQDGVEKILSKGLFQKLCNREKGEIDQALEEALPALHWDRISSRRLSISFLAKHRVGVSHFFYDMITRWLVPNKRLDASYFFSSDFRFSKGDSPLCTLAQITIELSEEDLVDFDKHKNRVDSEVRLGARSPYYANRILEFKDLSPDKKTEMIQKKIGSLMKARTDNYDKSIFSHMQRFLVISKDEFKSRRGYHHISRIISISHIIRKTLEKKIAASPSERHIMVKLIKAKLEDRSEKKPPSVLGLLVGFNFLQEREVFEESHLMGAIQKVHPFLRMVEDSFLLEKDPSSSMQTVYIEVMKKEAKELSLSEIQALRSKLPSLLSSRIEFLTNPIFMPRNEEEVLRNIMTLSNQLRYVQDIPQMIINFNTQEKGLLHFTVIFSWIVQPGKKEMQFYLQKLPKAWSWQIERSKKMGTMRRKYTKDAYVFSVQMPSKPFLQDNHFVDLYLAREHLVQKLGAIFGDIRDYNGGMMKKQAELIEQWKRCLGKEHSGRHFFMEKLFFSIQPSEMRSLLSCQMLKFLYLQVTDYLKKKDAAIDCSIKIDEKRMLILCKERTLGQKKRLVQLMQKLRYASCELFSFSVDHCFGFLFIGEDEGKKRRLKQCCEKVFGTRS